MPPLEPPAEEIIDALAEAEQAQQVEYAAENYNLAQNLEEGHLREIAQEIDNGFKDDEDSRQEWLEQRAYGLSLYMQTDHAENGNTDRDWGATESLPILAEACDQFQARTSKIFFPQATFISAEPVRKKKGNRVEMEGRAKRIGDHMSYQLGIKDQNFRKDKNALFLGVPLHGSFFTKTYFSDKRMAPQVDNVRPTDLVVNYRTGPVRIEDLRRKTHIIYTDVGETEEMAQKEFLLSPASPAMQMEGENAYNVKVNESMGLSEGSQNRVRRFAPAVLLEQHLYLDLDGKGIYRPYIGTLDAASKELKRLVIGYEATPDGQPLKDYEQRQFFTHYKYKDNPDGFYGLGLWHSIGELNASANILLRQIMDAATLANDGNGSGFIDERAGIDGEEIKLSLGSLRKVSGLVGTLDQSIKLMTFAGPQPALIQIMDALDQRAQRLGGTTEATTGTPSRAEQPTTYLAAIEQSLEQFSSVQMRLADAFGDELQKVFRLNQRYLPLVDYFAVNGEPDQITRQDYADDMMMRPVFDPKFSTQSQKVARAQAELQATLQNPVNQSRPQVLDAAFRRYFEAMDVEDIEELIPPQPQIENFDDQTVENMFFIQPKESRPLFDVFPEQNHAEHLAKMADLDLFADVLQPDQIEDILKHRLKHTAYLYGQSQGIIDPPPPGGVSAAPLAARSDVQMADGATSPSLSPPQAELLSQIVGGSAQGGGGAGGFGDDPPPAGG